MEIYHDNVKALYKANSYEEGVIHSIKYACDFEIETNDTKHRYELFFESEYFFEWPEEDNLYVCLVGADGDVGTDESHGIVNAYADEDQIVSTIAGHAGIDLADSDAMGILYEKINEIKEEIKTDHEKRQSKKTKKGEKL